eukprot:SAG11_NODE_29950_length_305_cov_1.252427_1_plen_51_part_10
MADEPTSEVGLTWHGQNYDQAMNTINTKRESNSQVKGVLSHCKFLHVTKFT